MSRHLTIDDLGTIAVPEQPALSPDATRIAYVLRTVDTAHDRTVRRLCLVDVDGGPPRTLTEGPSDSAPAWSPQGRLAFLRADGGPAQIWLTDGGTPTRLTALPLGAGPPVWSPDGSAMAFTAPVDRDAVEGEDDGARERRATTPLVTERLDYQVDGEGHPRARRRHLHVVDVASGACRQVTDGDWNAGTPAWSPNGRTLAFPAAMDADSDLTRRSGAYLVDAGGGKAPHRVGLAVGSAGALSWTADGTALLVAGTVGPPNKHYALLRVSVDDGTVEDLGRELDRNVMFGSPGYPGAVPRDTDDGRHILFCVRDRAQTHLYTVGKAGGSPTPLVTGGTRNASALSTAAGRVAYVLATERSFGEIASVDLATGTETLHTDYASALDGVETYVRVEREFVISDGRRVQGWIMRAPDATGPQRLLLDMHGGPHNAWSGVLDEVHLHHHELVARGWTVLLLNPRGSDGFGEEFFTAATAGWGVTDAKDFLEPLDTLVAEGIADPARLAVTGYSYGGFMTCFLTSRDSRFAVAVAGGLISDLTSMAGTADNARGLSESEFGGRPWADRARYAAMSPLSRVEYVRTPTLIMHGLADVRCPLGQAQQWHTALRELGVPTRLVLYPGAFHGFRLNGRPSHRQDYSRRVVDWVERWTN